MIFVDDRIGSKDLVKPLRRHHLPVNMRRMAAGDVAFMWRGPDEEPIPVGVEIKTIHDLLDSVISRRLQVNQLPGLLSRYSVVYIVVQGEFRPTSTGLIETRGYGGLWRPAFSRMTYSQLDGIMTTLELRAGIRFRRTTDRAETVAVVVDLYRWGQRPWDEHSSHLAVSRVSDLMPDARITVRPSIVLKVLSQLPGLGGQGGVRAKAAAKHFGTLESAFEAEQDEWSIVPGIGPVTAQKVVQAIRTRYR